MSDLTSTLSLGNGPHRYASEKDLTGGSKMMPPPVSHHLPQGTHRPPMGGGMYPPQHMPRMQPAKSVPALNSE